MLWAISNLGINNIINAGGGDHLRLKITRFAAGTGAGYTPLATMTALQGTEVYTGSLNSYTTQDGDTSVFKFVIPGSVPEFTFGELAIYADVGAGEFMFAIGVTDSTVTKKLGTGADIYTLLTYNNLSASISFSSNTVTLPVLADTTLLPRMADTTIEQYLVRVNDYGNTNGVVMVAKGGGTNRWMVEGYHEVGGSTPTSISSTQVVMDVSGCDFILENNPGNSGLMLQFYKPGANSHTIMREVTSTSRVGETLTLGYDQVLSAPDITYSVYLYVSKSFDNTGTWVNNLNDAKTAGLRYRYDPSPISTNAPNLLGGVLTVGGLPPLSLTQMALDTAGGIHTRYFDGSVWTGWKTYLYYAPDNTHVNDVILVDAPFMTPAQIFNVPNGARSLLVFLCSTGGGGGGCGYSLSIDGGDGGAGGNGAAKGFQLFGELTGLTIEVFVPNTPAGRPMGPNGAGTTGPFDNPDAYVKIRSGSYLVVDLVIKSGQTGGDGYTGFTGEGASPGGPGGAKGYPILTHYLSTRAFLPTPSQDILGLDGSTGAANGTPVGTAGPGPISFAQLGDILNGITLPSDRTAGGKGGAGDPGATQPSGDPGGYGYILVKYGMK